MANFKKKFSKIYDQYVEKIYRFIFLKVNSRDIAEDLCSETFLRAWKRFTANDKQGMVEIKNPQAFLYQIARNLVIDYYRGKSNFQIISTESLSIIDSERNLEEKIILNSEFENVRQALSELKDDYQNVIIWRYLDNLSIAEIARLLDKTEDATRVLLHRALKALKEKCNKWF